MVIFVNNIGNFRGNFTSSVGNNISARRNPIWGSNTSHKEFIDNGDENYIFLTDHQSQMKMVS